MKIKNVKISGLKIIQTKIFFDKRGFFKEVYKNNLIKKNFKFDVISLSKKNVIRGLHIQTKKPQAKVITVVSGKIMDVAVDLRKNSKTFGKVFKCILSEKNGKSIFIPPGFAHGFVTLSGSAIFSYKVDNNYSAEHDSGILWEDDELGIDWGVSHQDIKLSRKDKFLPKLRDFESPY